MASASAAASTATIAPARSTDAHEPVGAAAVDARPRVFHAPTLADTAMSPGPFAHRVSRSSFLNIHPPATFRRAATPGCPYRDDDTKAHL